MSSSNDVMPPLEMATKDVLDDHRESFLQGETKSDAIEYIINIFVALVVGFGVELFHTPTKDFGDHLFTVVIVTGSVVALIALAIYKYHLIKRRNAYFKLHKPAAPECYIRLSKLERDYSLLTTASINFRTWITFQKDVHTILTDFIKSCNLQFTKSVEDLQDIDLSKFINDRFGEALALVVTELESKRHLLLNYSLEPEEIYFFDIFELRNDDYLEPIARAVSETNQFGEPIVKNNRRWKVGGGEHGNAGHIGDAVYRGEALLMSNGASVSGYLDKQPKATDETYFKSRIIAPIKAADSRRYSTYGAVCITSSIEGRLTDLHKDLVILLTYPLSGLFYVREGALKKAEYVLKGFNSMRGKSDVA